MNRVVLDRIALLSAWRRGGAAAAVAIGALAGLGSLAPEAGLLAVGAALLICAIAHLALRGFLSRCALDPNLAWIGAVARCRRRQCSPRRRRQLAANLRQTARPSQRALQSEFVAWDRVRLVGPELLALADELEAAESVDPRTMVDVDHLLCDSRLSPLLNRSLPEPQVFMAVRSIRYRVASTPASTGPPRRRRRTGVKIRIFTH